MGLFNDFVHSGCNKQIAELRKQSSVLSQQCTSLTQQVNTLQQKLKLADEALIAHDHYAFSSRFSGMPSYDELLKQGKVTLSSSSDLQRKWKAQFGMTLITGMTSGYGKTDTLWLRRGLATCRYPLTVVQEFLRRSPVNQWKYVAPPQRAFACNDFAVAIQAEIELSPYWDMMLGVTVVDNHRINCVWCSDIDDIMFIEPQTDKLYKPDQKPKELLI